MYASTNNKLSYLIHPQKVTISIKLMNEFQIEPNSAALNMLFVLSFLIIIQSYMLSKM